MKRQRKPLGDLCTLVKGTSPISKTLPGPYTLVTTGETHKSADSYQFEDEAVCIPLISSTGHGHASLKRIHYQTGKFALANLLAAAFVKDRSVLSAKFLTRYLMYSKDRLIVPLMTGAANMSISIGRLATVPIEFPSLPEQERIVSVLDNADEVKNLRAAADHRSADLIPALFHEMFGDPLAHEQKWPEVLFEEVTNRITYGFTSPMQHLASGIPIITAKNVLNGLIDFENVHYADASEFSALSAKSKPNRGDILITKDGTIGRCAVVDVDFPICINQSVALVQPKHNQVTPVYLSNYILYPSVNTSLNGMGKGQALKHLQITELAKMPMPLPSLPLQQRFAERVAEIRALEAAQTTSRQQVEHLLQSMLHSAFDQEL